MNRKRGFRFLSLFLVFLLIQTTAINLFAQGAADKNDQRISGKLFDFDKKKSLPDRKVRIVHAESGQSWETETNKNGCFDFKDLPVGTYSLSATHEDLEYSLKDKIKLEPDIKLMACPYLTEPDALNLITDKSCECKEFPWLVFVLGAAAAPFLIGEDGDEEASPSRP